MSLNNNTIYGEERREASNGVIPICIYAACDEPDHVAARADNRIYGATQIIINDWSEQDYESGDEQHVFYVFAANDDGDVIGTFEVLHDQQSAIDYARDLSRRSGLPFGWD